MAGNIYEDALEQLEDRQQDAPANTPSIYERTIHDIDRGRRERLQQAISQADTVAPDRAAEVRQLSIGTGIPEPIVARQFDRIKKESKIRNTPFDRIMRETPKLATFLETPANAQLVQDDLEPLGALEWLLSAPQRAFSRGMNQIEVARLRTLSMQRPLTQAEHDLLESSRYHMNEGGQLGAGESWFRSAVTGAAAQLPILFGAVLQGAKRAIPAGVTTGTMGAAAGPIGGALTFGAGATAGMIAGGLEFAFQVEAGLAFDEFLDFKDEIGQRIDPNAAKAAALAAGALNAGLEVVGLGVLARSIPGVEKLTGAIGRSAVKQALRVPTVRAALVEAAKTYGTTLVSETAVETAQRAITVMGGELTKIAAGLPTKSGAEIGADLAHEALGALQAFSLLSLPGPALSVAGARAQAQRAQHNEQFFTALAEGVTQSKTFERMPEAVQEFLQEVTKDGPISTLYMPVESWSEYWTSKGEDPAEMAAEVTGSGDAFDQAIRTGEDLAIPTSAYAVKLAGTEHNQFFATELRLAPGEMNAREAKVFHEEQLALAQKQAGEEQATPTSGEMIRSALLQQLEGAGVERGTAESYAQLYESTFVNLAERAGVDPQQLFGQYGLKVARPDLPVEKQFERPESLKAFAGEQVEAAAEARGTEGDVGVSPAAQRLERVRNLPAVEVPEGYEEFTDLLDRYRFLDPKTQGPAEMLAAVASTGTGLSDAAQIPAELQLSTDRQTEILRETASRVQTRGDQKREVLRVIAEHMQALERHEDETFRAAEAERQIVDKKAGEVETQEGDDAQTELVPSAIVDRKGQPAGSRIAAIEPGTGRKAESRAKQHIEALFATVLEHAQQHEPTIDPAALRAEFEFRFDYWLEVRNIYAEQGHNPHDLLRAIAKLGGLYEADDRAGLYGELVALGKGNRFGAVAGVPGVFAQKRRAHPGAHLAKRGGGKARGHGFDVMLQMLQEDPRWSFIESIDHLIDLIDEAARHGVDKISTTELPGTDELRDVGIRLERAWWPDNWRPQNMLEDVTDEQLTEPVTGDTSFDVEEFDQGLFDDEIKEQFAAPKTDKLETGEEQPRLPGAGDVREQEVATPEVAELPFSLTAPVAKPAKSNRAQRTLFQEMPPLTQADLDTFVSKMKEGNPSLAEMDLRLLPSGAIQLETIAVTRTGSGIGTVVMQALTRLADKRNARIELSLAQKGYQPIDGGPKTSSRNRLKEFYKRFGFVENKGRHKDFSLSIYTSMYREPTIMAGRELGQPKRIGEPALLIQHNLTAKNLEHVLKVGGIAVPSLAIAKAEDALTNFGEITLLGSRRMAEPSRDTQVFGADVYAPRYPTVHFKISREGEKRLTERLKPYSDVTGVNYYDLDSLQKEGTRYLRESDGRAKAAFLDSRGLLDRPAIKAAGEAITDDRNSRRHFTIQRMLEDVIREKGLEAEFEAWADELFKSLDPQEQIFRGFTNQGNRSYTPHTLENVVKILKKELRGGESESNLYGVGQLRAKFTPRFRTLKQIQNARDLIVSDAEFEKVKKEVEDELFEITEELKPYYEHDAERFGFVDTVIGVMEDAPRMGLVRALAEFGFEGVPADVQTEIGEYLQKLRTLPTEYFEAKVTRAVGLGEFTAAIVPSNLKPELRSALEHAGLRVETYEKGEGRSDESRKAAISDLARQLGDDVLFQEPPAEGGRRGSIRFGADRQFTINLFERADLSTFIHETGHFYLEVFRDLANSVATIPAEQRTPQQQQLLADDAALRTWLVDEDHAGPGWSEKQHEQFARGFEAYLMEGKAPSAELRSAFARFRAWLIGIYRSLAGLHVNMTPEVRKVLDRMVATDDAIAAAEHDAGVAPMFTTKPAGMADAEWALYTRDVAEASRVAREGLERQLLEEVQREQRREWKERRAEIRQQVEAEVNEVPGYQALAAMQRGTKPDGTDLAEFKADPLKLSRKMLVEKFGEARLKKLPRPFIYRADGGMDPELVASMFGFSSADDMLTAIEHLEPAGAFIERETNRRMIEQQGSLLLDGTLHDKATAAIAGEHRERVIRAELRALWKQQRQAAPYLAVGEEAVRAEKREREYERRWFEAEARLRIAIAEGRKQVEIDALDREVKDLKERARRGAATINAAMPPVGVLREAARARIAATRVRDLTPAVFLQAAKRASAAAVDDAARQDLEGAIQAKQQELLNMAIYHEASKAKADIDKRIKAAQDLATTAARQRLGQAGQEYLDQVDGILDRYDFARVSQKALDRRTAIRAWVEALESEGIPVDLPDEVLDEARRIHFRELTVEALVGVTDGLQHIAHLARLKNRLLKSQADRELQATATDLATSIRANYKGKRRERSIETRLPDQQTHRLLEAFFAGHRKLASLARELDGFEDGGAMWEAVIRPLNAAADREAEMNLDATTRLGALVREAYPGTERIRLYDKVKIDAIGQSLTKMGRIMIALNWGNDGNRQRIKAGYGWSDQQVEAILETLDGRDWVFIQGVWDFIDSYWSQIAEKQQRVTGLAPEKVEATPVTTKFGVMRGGYFPIKYDDRQSAQAAGHVDLETANLQRQAAYVRATTRRGHTEARKARVTLPVRADFGVIFEHVQQVIHDLSHHEMLIDVGRILGHRDVQKAIYETYGDIVYRQFKDGLKDVAFGTVPAVGGFEKAINHLRQGATIAGLAWNLTTSALQPLGLTQSIVRIGAGPVARGMMRWLRSPKSFVETPGWINDKSTFMRTRALTQQREINELRNTVGINTGKMASWIDEILNTVSLSKFGRQDVVDSFFFLIQQMQRIADIPTWLGAYEKAMAAGESDERAVAIADQAVLDSQGGGQIKDLASVQRGGPLLRLWTNFYSFFNTTYNLAVESKRKHQSPGRVASDYLMLFIVPATLGFFLRRALRPGDDTDDEGWLDELARENVAYMMGMVLGLRELSGAAQGYAGYEGPAGARAFASAAKLVKQTEQGEADAAFWRALNDTAGTLLHYPAGQVRRTVEGFAALVEGKTANPIALITGAPRE